MIHVHKCTNIRAYAYSWKSRTGPWVSFVALHLAARRQTFPDREACHLATLSGEEVLCLPSLGSRHLAAKLFTLVRKIWTEYSCLQNKHSYPLSHFPSIDLFCFLVFFFCFFHCFLTGVHNEGLVVLELHKDGPKFSDCLPSSVIKGRAAIFSVEAFFSFQFLKILSVSVSMYAKAEDHLLCHGLPSTLFTAGSSSLQCMPN